MIHVRVILNVLTNQAFSQIYIYIYIYIYISFNVNIHECVLNSNTIFINNICFMYFIVEIILDTISSSGNHITSNV